MITLKLTEQEAKELYNIIKAVPMNEGLSGRREFYLGK